MCGICGTLDLSNGAPASRQSVAAMIRAIEHRGPDGSGIHLDRGLGLGHARLSIIDLEGGAQPMSIDGGSLWISFNGEIFNYVELREELIAKGHRFETRSDTEVILRLFQEEGEECVHRLNGQWAFAIWDPAKQRLFLSRDRLGVRPLYYTRVNGRFLFASEIKALFTSPDVPRELDLQGLDEIFTFWVTAPPRTAFRNILQLAPGHSMTVDQNGIRVWPYWQMSYALTEAARYGPVGIREENRLSEELLALLLDATRLRLRADVPVGAYLSGGLDSTVITALAAKIAGKRLQTFSVSFDDTAFDESRFQLEASDFLSTVHNDVRCSDTSIAEVFPETVYHSEQPVLRTAPAPMMLLSRLVRQKGIKVVLTGEGADEMLGGYDIFKEAKLRRFLARHPDSAWRPLLLKRLYPYMEAIQRQSPGYLKNFFHLKSEDPSNPFFSHTPRWELTARLKAFFSAGVREEIRLRGPADQSIRNILPPDFDAWGSFHQSEFLEVIGLLPGYILSSQGDRAAMANGVEGRYPFLDHRVVAFASTLPASVKMKVLNEKYLLKHAVKGLIPESIRNRAKQPYRAPDGKAFFPNPGPYVEEMLSEKALIRTGVFDPKAVGGLVSKFRAGRATGVKDNMALIGILSTQILSDRLVHAAPGTGKY